MLTILIFIVCFVILTYIIIKKPNKIWRTNLIQALVKTVGIKDTVRLFIIFDILFLFLIVSNFITVFVK